MALRPTELERGSRVEYNDAKGQPTWGQVDEIDPETGRVYVVLERPGRRVRVWFEAHELDRLRSRP